MLHDLMRDAGGTMYIRDVVELLKEHFKGQTDHPVHSLGAASVAGMGWMLTSPGSL